MVKKITILIKKKTVYIFPKSCTDMGVWVFHEPFLKTDVANKAEIVSLLKEGLDSNKPSLPHSLEFLEAQNKKYLSFMGSKSVSQAERGAKQLQLILDKEKVFFSIYRSIGRGAMYAEVNKYLCDLDSLNEEAVDSLMCYWKS